MISESSLTGPELEFVKAPTSVLATPGGRASFCARTRRTGIGKRPVEIVWEVRNEIVRDSGNKYQVSLFRY